MLIPYYLQDKLAKLNITKAEEIKHFGYLKVYKWLCHTYPQLSRKTLWDLYCIVSNLPINSLDKTTKEQINSQYGNLLPTYQPLNDLTIKTFMNKALEQAILAKQFNEIPIGAVVVKDDIVIGAMFNQTKLSCDITAHAEIMAIRQAQKTLNNFRLDNCDIYVTIEPCLMCAGCIINARIRRLVYGAFEPKTGAVVSQYQVFGNKSVNHHTEVIGAIDNNHYSKIIREFFLDKR